MKSIKLSDYAKSFKGTTEQMFASFKQKGIKKVYVDIGHVILMCRDFGSSETIKKLYDIELVHDTEIEFK